jgi:ribonuclease T2
MDLRIAKCLVVLGALAAVAGDAVAQNVPYRERPSPYQRGAGSERQHQAGEFDYYVLALSWSPTYCAGLDENRRDPQCHGPKARPYAFVLHGLWPQFERGWPQFCKTADRGFVPRPVANRMLDIMPSDKLIFHEYRKHGTCSGLGVDGYFDLSRQLYEKVKIPPRFVRLTDERLFVAPGELISDFLAANPGLKPDMMSVSCGGAGNRLREVRICFDKGGEFRACGRNEDQRRLCSADRMYVPPVRVSAGDADPPPPRKGRRQPAPPQDILPGPKDERRL